LPSPSVKPGVTLDTTLIEEKVRQARRAVDDAAFDAWLVFCRETDSVAEPTLPYVLGFDVVWPTAVVVGPSSSTVVLGRHDAPNAERLGVHEVRAYDESIQSALRATLDEMGAETVGLNFDRDDDTADGLTHGLFLRLQELLPERTFVSAGALVRRVRGIKSETEHDRIDAAAATTTELLAEAAAAWTPETTERDLVELLHGRLRERDLGTAWAHDYCPTVHLGGDSEIGHTLPGDHTLDPGELFHVDFGVRQDGYAADVQRLWVRGEPAPALQAVFQDVRAVIDAGRDRLEPGVAGHAVDAVAREELTDRGHPAFQHAFGHQVGRAAHAGGTLLGPEWERYGDAPRGTVRAGEVYTLELGVETEWGYVGQEEMVRVTASGTEWVVPPQTSLRRL